MQVTLKLFAMLRAKLPPESNGDFVLLELKEGDTPQVVIDMFEIPPAMAHLVMIDGFHLKPIEVRERALKEGEVLTIVPPVAGG